MNLSDEIRKQIEKNKGLKLAVGEINNHLSILEGLARKDISERLDEAYKKGFEDGKKAPSELASSAEYQRGLNDAWEAARKIVCDDELDWNTLLHIFNRGNFDGIFGDFSPSEAIDKLKSYKEKQKADGEIKVGDEVIYNGTTKCIVVRQEDDERYASLIDSDGTHHHADHSECKKTGRHFDIASILEDMRK